MVWSQALYILAKILFFFFSALMVNDIFFKEKKSAGITAKNQKLMTRE